MRTDRRLIQAIAVISVATLLWLLLTMGLIAATLERRQFDLLAEHLMPSLALVGLTWALGLVPIAATLRWLFRRFATAPARLLEQTRVLLAAPAAAPLNHQGSTETQALADAIFELASQRDALREDVAAQIAQANLSVQQEKNRLAALMSELTQSVVVCNLDGRIILYNNRARLQFKTMSQAPTLSGGAELLGIGRSIYAVFEQQLVTHALESIQQPISRGAGSPSAQFVT
ncbi:MAG: DNA polymerase III subunit epsilon, partial [Rhodoferax sp.]